MNARDVVIIGCGIAGPAAALFLRRAGFHPRIYEAAPGPRDEEGAFFNVAPNGMHVLGELGVEEEVRRMGHRTRGLVFHNESGVEIGRLDGSRDEELFGASSVLIPRGAIGRILREKAEREGIPVFFGKRLVEIEEGRDGIRAVFEDGSEATRPCPPQREFQSAGWRARAMVPRPHVAALSQGRGARRAAGLRLPPAVGGRLTRRSAFAPNGGGDDGWPRRRARKTSKRFSRREGPSARRA